MKYSFEVKLGEQDYYEFNKFWMLRSHYGKKSVRSMRVMLAVVTLAFALFSLYTVDFTAEGFLTLIPYGILMLLGQLVLNPFFALVLKGNLKRMRKSGKMPYSAVSQLSFFEDHFEESAEEGKTEHPYTALERISAVEGKMLYLHLNNVQAYLVPYSVFENHAQYVEFLSFLVQKCSLIDHYQK